MSELDTKIAPTTPESGVCGGGNGERWGSPAVDISSIQAPALFAAWMKEADDANAMPLGASNAPCATEDFPGAVQERAFALSCRVEFETAGACVIVKELHYRLTPKAGHDARDPELADKCYDRPMPAAIRGRQWSETI